MTVDPNSIDLSAFMAEHLERAEPDLLRSMLSTFVRALMSAEADAICGAPYGERSPERTNSRNGYRTREFDTRTGTMEVAIPKLREGVLLPRLAARATPPCRAGTDHGGGDLLPARCLHEADGEAGRDPRYHPAVQVAGLGDGQGTRRPRRGLPHPATGPGALHVPGRGRVDDEGPRGWPGGQHPRAGRHRRQRRWAPRDPRSRHLLGRVRGRLVDPVPRSERPRPVRGQAG